MVAALAQRRGLEGAQAVLTHLHTLRHLTYHCAIRILAKMANVVGERFQITIDKMVREKLGIRPGDRAIERVEDGRLVVSFMPAPHSRSLMGIFHRPGIEPMTNWQEIKDRAWAARSAEIMEVLGKDSRRHPRG